MITLGVIEQQKTKKLYQCDMAFSLGIVTILKIWYNTRMESKEWWALGNAPPREKRRDCMIKVIALDGAIFIVIQYYELAALV